MTGGQPPSSISIRSVTIPKQDGKGRVLFKGQLFSAPMNWDDLLEQLKELEAHEPHISLPVHGAVLAARVRITIA